MRKRSLSASLGSWCVQLIYKPRRSSSRGREEAVSVSSVPVVLPEEAWALLPALLAVFVCVASAIYALSTFVMVTDLGLALGAALTVGAFLALTAHCAPRRWRRVARLLRYPFLLVLLFFGFSLLQRQQSFLKAELDVNGVLAILLGFAAVSGVFLLGAPSRGRTVSLSAPLVPALALLVVLALASLDVAIQVCLFVFTLSAVYLCSYRPFLRCVVPEMAQGKQRSCEPVLPERRQIAQWAVQAFLVSSSWLGLFALGGLILFLPMRLVLPGLVASPLSQMRAATRHLSSSYQSTDTSLQLNGGMRTLSDREALRISVLNGETSGLWRGRTYERYSAGSWEEVGSWYQRNGDIRAFSFYQQQADELWPGNFQKVSLPLYPGLVTPLKKISPKWGRLKPVLEQVEMHNKSGEVVYASGHPLSWREQSELPASYMGGRPPYTVRSVYIEPRLNALAQAPGYETVWPRQVPPILTSNLQKAPEESVRQPLAAIANQIAISSGHPQTPYAKVKAVAAYLSSRCTYSLDSPGVPAHADPVVHFLSDSQRGACDMFASSMVLLLREMNVPARLTTGYLQNDDLSGASTQVVDGLLTYSVRERDAHAWVEYYVPRFGWLAYDPTEGTQVYNGGLAHQVSTLLDWPTWKTNRPLWIAPIFASLFLALALALNHSETRRKTRPKNAQEKRQRYVMENYAQARHVLRARVADGEHLSPREYEARVDRAHISAEAKQEFAALTHLYILARYGSTVEVEEKDLRASVSRLRAAMKKQV